MPPQMIPTCLHARALYARRPSTSLRFRCVTGRTPCWRGGRPVTRSPMRAGNPVERHVCSFRIRRCVHLDKLAALNLTSFISSKRRSNASPWNVLHVRETISGLRVLYIVTVNTWPMPSINLSASLFRGDGQIMRPIMVYWTNTRIRRFGSRNIEIVQASFRGEICRDLSFSKEEIRMRIIVNLLNGANGYYISTVIFVRSFEFSNIIQE